MYYNTFSPKIHIYIIGYLSNCLFFLTVDPPKITQHPESKSVATGTSTTFTVEASGDELQFQWRKDGKDLHDGDKNQGTKTHTLHIKHVDKSDKGSYQCLVKNDVGEKLSEEADLGVGKFVAKLCNMKNNVKEKLSEEADLAVSELVIKLMSFPFMYIRIVVFGVLSLVW